MATNFAGVHTVVFDLDDTLYLEREYVLSGFSAASAWLARHRGAEGFFDCARSLFENRLRGRIFDHALAQMGIGVDPTLVAELVSVYRAHSPTLTLLPDAVRSLDWVRGRARIGLLTDGYHAVQRNKVQGLGIAERFDEIVFTDALGREFWKPRPEGFQQIMSALPGEADGFLYVADNPRKDFIGPRSLGWRTIRIRRPGGEHADYDGPPEHSADVEITSLLELEALLG